MALPPARRIVPRDADQQEYAAAEIPAGDARPGRPRHVRLRGGRREQRTSRSGSATAASSTRPTGTTARTPSRPRTSRGLPRSPPPVRPPVSRLAWAWVDPDSGEEAHEDGERVVPAASTIKLFVASAFWRSALDPGELVEHVPPAGSAGVSEYLSAASRLTLGDLALLMLAVSDNAATNVLLDRLGFDAVNAEIGTARPRADGRAAADDEPAAPRTRRARSISPAAWHGSSMRRASPPLSSSRSTASSATTCRPVCRSPRRPESSRACSTKWRCSTTERGGS